MKKIYSVLSLLLVMSIALSAQTRIYAPTLKAPENGKINQMPNVTLDWLAVTGISLDITYEAQLATSSDFSNAVTYPRSEFTSVQTTDLLFGQKYYWRVRAFDQEIASNWSQTFTFDIAWTLTLRSQPSDGSMVYSNPEITWNPLTGISGYQFQIDTSYAWNTAVSGVTALLNSTFVLNESDIWAVGAGGVIIHFDGTSWIQVESGVSANLNDVWFVDATHGYAVGDGGSVIFYDGTTWSSQSVGITTNLYGVSFADVDKGVVVGAGGNMALYNTGVWTVVTSDITTDINDVAMVAENNIWACGAGKKVVHYDGSTWSSEVVGTKDYNGISFQDDNNGWVVGVGGVIYHYDGAAWIEEKSNTTKELKSVSVFNYKGIAVGLSGTIVSLDGGWSLVTSGVSTALSGVSVIGNYGVIVGAAGTVLQKTDEGFNSPLMKIVHLTSDKEAYQLTNLYYGKTYYYRMRALHGSDTSSWSQVKSMTTYPSVTLTSPSNAAVADLLNLHTWSAYAGLADYVIEVDDNNQFTSATVEYSDSASTYLLRNYFGQEYFWRVSVRNAFDQSDWSPVYSFVTKSTVTLQSPSNGLIDVSSCPKFIWEEIVGSPEYEVSVAKTSSFSDPITSIVTTSFMQCAAQLAKNTAYYWKVRGITLMDTSSWSQVWSFTTEGYIGINEHLNGEMVSIYPNPSNGVFTLSLESYTSDEYTVKVADITGRILYRNSIMCQPGANLFDISLPEMQQGLYTVIITNGDDAITEKLMIK